MKKLPYIESSVFIVPLPDRGYARGVVARTTSKGKILLGYFFGPRLPSNKEVALNDLHPDKSILCVRFGDLGLINGEWLVVGTVPNWKRSEWSMPDFVRRDELSKKAWLVRYSDNDPSQIDEEYPTDFDSELGRDSVSGYGAVELKLAKLLSNPSDLS